MTVKIDLFNSNFWTTTNSYYKSWRINRRKFMHMLTSFLHIFDSLAWIIRLAQAFLLDLMNSCEIVIVHFQQVFLVLANKKATQYVKSPLMHLLTGQNLSKIFFDIWGKKNADTKRIFTNVKFKCKIVSWKNSRRLLLS